MTIHKIVLGMNTTPYMVETNLSLWQTRENFQGWAYQGYAAASYDCYAGADPLPGDLPTISKSYGTVNVDYKIHNGGVVPTCGPRGPKPPAVPVLNFAGSIGYVEIGKGGPKSSTDPTKVYPDGAGYMQTSAFTYLEKIDVYFSFSGGNRYMGVSWSTDNGATWTLIPTTQESSAIVNDSLNPTLAGPTGNTSRAVYGDSAIGLLVQKSNVMLRFGTGPERSRIHDIYYYFQPTGVENTVALDNGAKIYVSDNNINVSSTNNGIVEITNMSGLAIGEKEIVAGKDVAFQSLQSGVYIVRFVANGKVAVKKVIVQ